MATEKIQPQDETIPSDFKVAELEEGFEEETERGDRRKGGAFDTLARILRGVVEVGFSNSFLIRNRPGRPVNRDEYVSTGLLPFQSMFEMFFRRRAKNSSLNGITVGRQGDGRFRNTNYIQLEADHDTDIGDSLGYVNGVIRARVSRNEGDETDRSGLYVMDRGTESSSREGTVNWLVGAGEGGQVRLSYMTNKNDDPLNDAIFDLYLSENGFTFFGLPTTAQASGRVWNNGGVLNIGAGGGGAGGAFGGRVADDGTAIYLPSGWSSAKTFTGVYTITHNLGHTNYSVAAVSMQTGTPAYTLALQAVGNNTFRIDVSQSGSAIDIDFAFVVATG